MIIDCRQLRTRKEEEFMPKYLVVPIHAFLSLHAPAPAFMFTNLAPVIPGINIKEEAERYRFVPGWEDAP